jgi:hypothetical protein
MHLLLHVPIEILYQQSSNKNPVASTDNVHLWKGVMIKALELGYLNNNLAMTCIKMLEKWFNLLPLSITAELYSDVLPKLSDFLSIESNHSDSAAGPSADGVNQGGIKLDEKAYF